MTDQRWCCPFCGQALVPRSGRINPPDDWIGTWRLACPEHGQVEWKRCTHIDNEK